nr:hypothetical protein [uncultured Flavobacterium sp.]
MKNKIILVLFCLITLNTFGQAEVCDCCTYSLKYEEAFENKIIPEVIKKNNIKILTIYNTSKEFLKTAKDTTYRIVNKEYKEMILKFNSSGYVIEQISFYHGRYNDLNEFLRDNKNKILSKTFYYLDSLGNKDKVINNEWSYIYFNGLLKQKKELDYNQKIQPDNKSSFESYEYDINGRIIKEIMNTFIDDTESIYYQTITKYDDVTKSSTSITRDKKNVFSTTNSKYDSNQKPLDIKYYEGENNKILEQKKYTYNKNGQLIKLIVKNFGIATECPDNGNYSDTYFYSSLNLIDKIKHQFGKNICELRFEYK